MRLTGSEHAPPVPPAPPSVTAPHGGPAVLRPRRRRTTSGPAGRPSRGVARRTPGAVHGATGPALGTHRSFGRRRADRHVAHPLPAYVVTSRLPQTPETRRRVLAAVDHELRTPLTAVLGYVELLLDGEAGRLDEDQARMLQRIDANAARLLTVVGTLLDGARDGLQRGEVIDLVGAVVEALGGADALCARMPGTSEDDAGRPGSSVPA